MQVHGISIMSKPDFSNYLAHFTKDSVCVNEGNVLDDRYCNLLLDLFKDCDSEVVVNSPLMENYLKENYYSNLF